MDAIVKSGGRIAQAVGANFEAWLEGQHEKAKRLGILVHIEKTQARTAFIKGRLQYSGKGVADYIGTLERGGRTLAVEAKSAKGDRLERSAIETKQAEHLDAVAHAGGLALLLVEYRPDEVLPVRCAVPWLEVPWEVLRTAQSVATEAVLQWQIARDPEGCYLERFHARGPRSFIPRQRVIARD